jgi:hypothetical protein
MHGEARRERAARTPTRAGTERVRRDSQPGRPRGRVRARRGRPPQRARRDEPCIPRARNASARRRAAARCAHGAHVPGSERRGGRGARAECCARRDSRPLTSHCRRERARAAHRRRAARYWARYPPSSSTAPAALNAACAAHAPATGAAAGGVCTLCRVVRRAPLRCVQLRVWRMPSVQVTALAATRPSARAAARAAAATAMVSTDWLRGVLQSGV